MKCWDLVDYKDYYKILGVPKTRDATRRSRPPTASSRASTTRRQQGRRQGGGALQGDQRGQRGPVRPRQAAAVRPARRDWASYRPGAGGPGPGRRAGRGRPSTSAARTWAGSPTSSARSSGAAAGFGGGRSGGPAAVRRLREVFGRRRPTSRADVETRSSSRWTRSCGAPAHGAGRRRARRRKVEVKIPPGVREGRACAWPERAATGARGGPRGRPLPAREEASASRLRAQGRRPATPVTVPLTTAVLGGEVPVPTLDGPVGSRSRPARRPAASFRLRNHGLPRLEAGGGRGDLLATLSVDLPASCRHAREGALRGAAADRALSIRASRQRDTAHAEHPRTRDRYTGLALPLPRSGFRRRRLDEIDAGRGPGRRPGISRLSGATPR